MPNSVWQQKDRDTVLEGLRAQGANLRETKHTHLAVFPNGGRVGIPKTPSSYRSVLNTRAAVRRYGYEWPLDGKQQPNRRYAQDSERLIDRISKAVDALGTPDMSKIKAWLREHRYPVGQDEPIKDALRTLGWREERGQKFGRGYRWNWVRADEDTTITPEQETMPTTIEWVDGIGDPVPADDIITASEPTLSVANPVAETLPATLSPDAELMLREAERMEKRALDAEHQNAHFKEQIDRIISVHENEKTQWKKDLRTRDDEIARLTTMADLQTKTIAELQNALEDCSNQMTVTPGNDESWPAEIHNPSMSIQEFIDGAAAYGLVPDIRLRRK